MISGPNGLVRISRGFRALLRWAERWGRAAQSGGLGWYGAFLQNAGLEGVGVPRAMLWYTVSRWDTGRGRREVGGGGTGATNGLY